MQATLTVNNYTGPVEDLFSLYQLFPECLPEVIRGWKRLYLSRKCQFS
ncbi:MAG: hypothetical protein ACLUDU_03410 [Butyricimonas faecihominis]